MTRVFAPQKDDTQGDVAGGLDVRAPGAPASAEPTSQVKTPMGGIERKTTVDVCADVLRRAILSGEMAPGARLPPERELAEQLGVNRMTLRSALARLALEGLLSARQGSGHTVKDFRQFGGPGLVPAVLDVLDDARLREAAVRDLLATRRLFARLIFERAAAVIDRMSGAERAKGGSLDRLRIAVGRFQLLCQAGVLPEELALADGAIVEALVGVTASPVLPLFMNSMLQVLGAMPELLAAIYVEPRGNAAGWATALAWLEADPRPPAAILEQTLERRDEVTMGRMFGRAGKKASGGVP